MMASASREIDAAPEVVWALITDVAGTVDLLSAVTEVTILAGPNPVAVGTTWRETRRMFGREATEEMTVTALVPGHSYTVTADNHGTAYVSTLRVEPSATGTGCVLTMTFTAEAKGLVGRVAGATIGRLFAPATRKALVSDLDDIAKAAQGA